MKYTDIYDSYKSEIEREDPHRVLELTGWSCRTGF